MLFCTSGVWCEVNGMQAMGLHFCSPTTSGAAWAAHQNTPSTLQYGIAHCPSPHFVCSSHYCFCTNVSCHSVNCAKFVCTNVSRPTSHDMSLLLLLEPAESPSGQSENKLFRGVSKISAAAACASPIRHHRIALNRHLLSFLLGGMKNSNVSTSGS